MEITLKPLEEQVIVITGAASGIGLATALAASMRGAKLVLAAHSAEVLDTIVEKINAAGGDAIGVPTDIGKRESLEALARAAIRHYGRIDTWVNDAGLSAYGRSETMIDDDSRAMFDVHFWSVVNGSLIAVRHIKQAGGAIINLGSAASEELKGFHEALRLETEKVDRAPISVTLVQPGSVSAEPEQVAEAILAAAAKATRFAKVAPSKIDTLLRSLSSANNTQRFGHAHGTRAKSFH